MDRSREEGRLEGDVHLDVDVRGCERRDGDGHCDEERCVPLLGHEPDERAGDLFTAWLAGGQVRQDRKRDDSHVDRDDGGGNRDRESESEEDVEPRPPGDGPQQQIGPAEAEKTEHDSNGEHDPDVHGVTAPLRGRREPARRRSDRSCRTWRRFLGRRRGERQLLARRGFLVWRRARRRRLARRRRTARCGRRLVVGVTRLERDRRRAAKGLEVRHHAEDLLIGQANRRPVDGGHPRIESRHDEAVRFVHRLGEVLDIAQARDAAPPREWRRPRGRGTGAPRSGRSCGRSGTGPWSP